ncbi:hypothetical protein [Microbacterium sp. NPDC080220]|uniref:hypothetical protein n=1 Tax=Microbacterium sp. NPDC080220 TaxID=3161017 RepID=UPI00344091BB
MRGAATSGPSESRSELDRVPDEDIVETSRQAGRFILDELMGVWEMVDANDAARPPPLAPG